MMVQTVSIEMEAGYYPQFKSHLWHYKKYDFHAVLRGQRLMYYRWLIWLYGQEKADDEMFMTFFVKKEESGDLSPENAAPSLCREIQITERNYTTE